MLTESIWEQGLIPQVFRPVTKEGMVMTVSYNTVWRSLMDKDLMEKDMREKVRIKGRKCELGCTEEGM